MPRGRNLVQQRAHNSRERILEAAAHLFAQQGIAGTSTNRIAQQADMSIGLLYRYFANKEDIAAVLQRRLAKTLERNFTQVVFATITLEPAEAVAQCLSVITETLSEHSDLVRAFESEGTRVGIFGGVEERLQMLTRTYLLQHLGPLPDSELEARAFVLATAGLAMSYRIGVATPPGISQQQLTTVTAKMLSTLAVP
ncbi:MULTISPECIES: TetR/AcrR family transcriptional regulator [unclassified Mycobacteroides]|uniref:TetR/AcrR family transcriptional regulator n=1 Tax=unclassified Mycobacteroides TaxID=2618759 RepID=UPI001396A079|nr:MULTISPECIES: TetR/AcrR family transcriptional regulator [unclassified Mycobacteroides]